MQIKKIYLDLEEAKPEERFGKDVYVLHSEKEAFKEPLTLQIEYDPKDVERVKNVQDEVNVRLEEFQRILNQEQEYANTLKQQNDKLKEELLLKEQQIQELKDDIKRKERKEVRIQEELDEQQDQLILHSGYINQTKDKLSEIEKKLTKQPSVINDTTFLSGIGESYLTMVNIPDGEYLYIQKTKIVEKNEYVANEDDIVINRIHVNGGTFTPPYTLRGTDAVSTPTATIDRTLVFIPI